MTNLYLTEQGSYLRKRGEQLIYEKDGEVLLEKPMREVGSLALFGAVQLSVQAMLALLEKGCEISLLTGKGHFRGRVVPSFGANSPLRVKQHRLCAEEEFRLETSRKIVSAKILNGAAILRRYHRSGKSGFKLECAGALEMLAGKAAKSESIAQLRGYEGSAARRYFAGFGQLLKANVQFPGRKYYPSTDPVNATLSFGYSFVAREIQGLLEASGLDPFIGIYHEVDYGRASLSMDVLEEFRHGLVDSLTLSLFNRKFLTAGNFETGEGGGLYLKREALKLYVKHYEKAVNSRVPGNGPDGQTWRESFRVQALGIRKRIEHDEEYVPFRVKR